MYNDRLEGEGADINRPFRLFIEEEKNIEYAYTYDIGHPLVKILRTPLAALALLAPRRRTSQSHEQIECRPFFITPTD